MSVSVPKLTTKSGDEVLTYRMRPGGACWRGIESPSGKG